MKHLIRCLTVALAVLATTIGASSAVAAPSQPAIVGSFTDANVLSGALAVAVSGHYAYTATYWSGRLAVIDISNPTSPTLVGYTPSTSSLTNASTVNISGNYAFVVAKNRNGPCQPGPVPSCNSGSNDDGTGNALTVIDISNPSSPTIVGQVRDPNKLFGSYGVAVSGHYAYVAYQGLLIGQPGQPDTSTGGFSVIDLNNLGAGVVANIDNGVVVGGHNYLWHATSVNISGHYAYVTGFYDRRITVVDIANPLAPKVVASLRDALNLWNAADVAVQGNYAYVADQNPPSTPQTPTVQFAVVNVSNPLKPVVVAAVSNPVLAGTYRIRVHGNFAYLAASGGNAISAIDISNPTNPRLAGWVQNTAHLYDSTGLDVDPTGRYVVSASPLQSGQAKQTWPAYPLQTGGPVNTGSVNVIDMVPAPIAVTIDPTTTPANPTTATSASFSFSVSDAVSTVQCSLDGSPLGACTTATTQQYSSLGNGTHTFTVQAADATGATSSASYTWTVGTAAQNSSQPGVTGSASPGQTLSASPGSWSGSPAPSFSYQWQQCDPSGQNCTPISGQTGSGSTYVVQPGDAGSTLSVVVTGTNSLGSSSAASPATPVVTTPPNVGTLPSLSGQATVGGQLTGAPGSWSGYPAPSLSYQWQQCDKTGQNCTPITGATGSTYSPVAADAGSTLVFQVTGSNSAGTSQAASQPTSVVTQAPQNIALPGITGTPTPGQTLTASSGSWSGYPLPTLSYQWQQCDTTGQNCTPINGAGGSTYAVQSTDGGSTLAVMVTATNILGSFQATSTATTMVPQGPTVGSLPAASGQATVGGLMTGSPGTWSGSPAPSFAYQWLQCDLTGQTCSQISGATSTTYTPVSGDAGSTLEFQVTASNSSGSTQVSSPATAGVTQAPQNTALPGIGGAVTQGQTLTASTGSWSGYPAPSFSFAWQQCDQNGQNCAPISGATNSTYTPQPGDTGLTLAVTVTALNSVGSASQTSSPTGRVSAAPTYSAVPTLSGTAQLGQTLAATPGTWSGYPQPGLTYTWQRCNQSGQSCAQITGAMSPTYVLTPADVGSTVLATVTGTNVAGQSSASSAPSAIVTGAPSNTGAPSISGNVTLGGTVSASPGQWSAYPAPTFTYVWQRCSPTHCATISGATGPTYVAQRSEVGFTIGLTVTASNSLGASAAAPVQSAIVTGAPLGLVLPVVSGTVATGNVLSSTTGSWSGYPTVTPGSFQWQRCNSSGSSCVSIPGATSTSYTVTSADLGSSLRFTLYGRNSLGSAFERSAQSTLINTAGILHGTRTPTPTLNVGVEATTAKPVSQITISPPRDISFQNGSSGHVKGLEVTDAHGKRLSYTARISHGSMIITLARNTASLRVVIGNRALLLARDLTQRVRGTRSTTVAVQITYNDFGKLRRHVLLKVRAT